MGYRSDVRIIVSKEGYRELCDYVKTHALEHQKKIIDKNIYNKNDVNYVGTPEYDYNLLNHCDKIFKSDDGDEIMISWEYIKWYDGQYEDVDIIMSGLDWLQEHNYSYRFTRIGENYDDIEELYYDGTLDQDLYYIDIIREFTNDNFVEVESGDIYENK